MRGIRVSQVFQLGQTEVDQFRIAIFRNQNVRRLNIAMENSGFVRCGETVRNSNKNFHYLLPASLLVYPIFQRTTVHKFGNEVFPSFKLSNVMNRKNMWVIE